MANWFDENAPGGNTGVNGGANMAGGQAQPDLAAFQRDYWAPDREQVLASMQQPQAQAQTGQQGGGDWISQALSGVQSTDDPSYWRKVIGEHGDTNNSAAQAYWIDRIKRGDGSALVKSGQLQRVNDSGGGAGSLGYGGLLAPYSAYKTPDPFQAPTVTDQNAPGYQFAKQQGMQGIERSAAARGGLLTGGTLKALDAYNTGLANQTYGDVFNRALSQYQTNANTGIAGYQANQGTFYGNQDHAWQKLYQSMGLGQNSSTAGATGA